MHLILETLFSDLRMEDNVRFPLRMLVAVLLIVPACNRNEPRKAQAASEERKNAAKQANAADQMRVEQSDRNDYVAAIDDRLAGLDLKIDKLDQQANAMTGTTKEKFRKAVDAVRDQRKSVGSRLDDLKKADIESWRPLSWEVNSGLASLENSYTQVQDIMDEMNPDTSATRKDKMY
jgi:hypothetical protein